MQKQEILFRQKCWILHELEAAARPVRRVNQACIYYVQVHYTGTLEDGSVFDTSLEGEPLEFEIGGGKVIPGFDDAVMGLAEGEKRKQLVPAERAYGK